MFNWTIFIALKQLFIEESAELNSIGKYSAIFREFQKGLQVRH